MTRTAIITALTFVLCGTATAAQPPAEWIRFYNGPADQNDWGRDIDLASDGSVTVVGGTLPVNLQEDMAVVRYDANGNQVWAATYNGPSNGVDRATGVASDDAGNAFMIGNLWNNVALNQDYVIIKYLADGTQAWVKQFNGPGSRDDVAWDVRADGAGGAFVAGGAFLAPGTPFLAKHFHVARYDADGNIAWQVNYDLPGRNGATATKLIIAPDGNLVVSGWIRTAATGVQFDMLTMKVSPAGQVIWTRQWSPPVGEVDDIRMVLKIDDAGNVYATTTVDTEDIYKGLDSAVVKYSADGTFQWTTGISLDGHDGFSDLVADEAGNIYLTGGWNNGSEFSDGFTVSFDSSGVQRWIRFYDDTPQFDFQEGQAIMRGPDGLIYVGLDWQHPDAAGYDYTIEVLDTDGNPLDFWRYDTGGPSDTFFEFGGWRMDPAGNIYIGAYAVGPTGNSDITTVKIATQPTAIAGDMDGDGDVDFDDRDLFVAVLVDLIGEPGQLAAADLNGDQQADARDLPMFITALLGG